MRRRSPSTTSTPSPLLRMLRMMVHGMLPTPGGEVTSLRQTTNPMTCTKWWACSPSLGTHGMIQTFPRLTARAATPERLLALDLWHTPGSCGCLGGAPVAADLTLARMATAGPGDSATWRGAGGADAELTTPHCRHLPGEGAAVALETRLGDREYGLLTLRAPRST